MESPKNLIPDLKMQKKQFGFSLLELLVVISIIGILAGLIFTGASYLFRDNANKQASLEIEVLKMALEEFRQEFGSYPVTPLSSWSEKEGSKILTHALLGTHQYEESTESWEWLDPDQFSESLISSDDLNIKEFESGEDAGDKFNWKKIEHFLIDPWGEPYIYQFERADEHSGYLLYSKGADMKSQPFDSPLTSEPDKRAEDLDNIPANEPGKW